MKAEKHGVIESKWVRVSVTRVCWIVSFASERSNQGLWIYHLGFSNVIIIYKLDKSGFGVVRVQQSLVRDQLDCNYCEEFSCIEKEKRYIHSLLLGIKTFVIKISL